MNNLLPSTLLFTALSLLTGVIYPLAVTGFGQLTMAEKANGSLIFASAENGEGKPRCVGSALVGQTFDKPGYFHGRPSAIAKPYDASSSGASNLAASNPAFAKQVEERVRRLQAEEIDTPANNVGATSLTAVALPLPSEMLTASGSGLDPDISPQAALLQVPRIAHARGMLPEKVRDLVESSVTERQCLILGQRRINVLSLNIALDKLAAQK